MGFQDILSIRAVDPIFLSRTDANGVGEFLLQACGGRVGERHMMGVAGDAEGDTGHVIQIGGILIEGDVAIPGTDDHGVLDRDLAAMGEQHAILVDIPQGEIVQRRGGIMFYRPVVVARRIDRIEVFVPIRIAHHEPGDDPVVHIGGLKTINPLGWRGAYGDAVFIGVAGGNQRPVGIGLGNRSVFFPDA